MLRLKLTLFILIFCSSYGCAFQEHENQEAYQIAQPLGKHDGKDGHWLKSDRKQHNQVWNTANEVNLLKSDGFTAYHQITERSDFYKWLQLKTDSLGFETKWAGVAAITTRKLSTLLTPLPSLTGNTNREIKDFITYGNQLIFDDIWPTLQKLVNGKILIGVEAKAWDGDLLLREQQLIDPSYIALSHHSLNKLEKSLRKENLLSQFIPGLEFEGDLLNIQDRWNYGMKMMGHHLSPTQRKKNISSN